MIEQSFYFLVKYATLQDKQVIEDVYDFQALIDIVSSPDLPALSHLLLLIQHLKIAPLPGDCAGLLPRLLDLSSTKDHRWILFVMECTSTLLEALRTQNMSVTESHRIRLISSLNDLISRTNPDDWPCCTAFAWLCAQTHLSGTRPSSTLILAATDLFLHPNLLGPEEDLPVAVWLDFLREWIVGIAKDDFIYELLLPRLLALYAPLKALSEEGYNMISRLIRTLTAFISMQPKRMPFETRKAIFGMATAS